MNFWLFILFRFYFDFDSGSYAYINMGQTHNAGDRARIISPLQAPSAGGACLSFWYHMSGINIDRFAVYLRADDSDSIVFTRTGTQGDEWIRGEKTIQMDTAWQVGERGIKGL